jgi:hypothetical protein
VLPKSSVIAATCRRPPVTSPGSTGRLAERAIRAREKLGFGCSRERGSRSRQWRSCGAGLFQSRLAPPRAADEGADRGSEADGVRQAPRTSPRRPRVESTGSRVRAPSAGEPPGRGRRSTCSTVIVTFFRSEHRASARSRPPRRTEVGWVSAWVPVTSLLRTATGTSVDASKRPRTRSPPRANEKLFARPRRVRPPRLELRSRNRRSAARRPRARRLVIARDEALVRPRRVEHRESSDSVSGLPRDCERWNSWTALWSAEAIDHRVVRGGGHPDDLARTCNRSGHVR